MKKKILKQFETRIIRKFFEKIESRFEFQHIKSIMMQF
jgi:hypothetical protein